MFEFITWHSPLAFLLFIPLAFVLLYVWVFYKKTKGVLSYSSLSLFSKKAWSLRAKLVFLPTFFKFIALSFIILALARPQTKEQISHQTQRGLDIMIVMDISLSMLIQDMGKQTGDSTRLEASRQVIKEFISYRPYDRLGLIVFSGESFTKVPLTLDHDLLLNSLSKVKTLPTIKEGTAIGVALANGVARLKNSPPKSRIMIFLTDGENNAGFIHPETALQLVKKHKIKVYTIGLGSANGTFPIRYEVKDSLDKAFTEKAWSTVVSIKS